MSAPKAKLHPRNPHNQSYDFTALCQAEPELTQYVFTNKYGTQTIDFKNDQAVLMLNAALLKSSYGLTWYQVPQGFLCPAIPGRADYVHYLADLLGEKKKNPKVRLLDIGCGANLVYPIIANKSYRWQVVGAELNREACENAQAIIVQNGLNKVEVRPQQSEEHIFTNMIQADEYFDVTMCNPPFHEHKHQARVESAKKWQNLGVDKSGKELNFGGQANELWCKGGELTFIKRMMQQSMDFSQQVLWFSSLVSKRDHVTILYAFAQNMGVKNLKVVEMKQGQKVSRFIAWSFFDEAAMQAWKQFRLA